MTDTAAASAPAATPAVDPRYAALLALKEQGLTFTDCVFAFGESDENAYVAAARNQVREGEIEVDDTTVVSDGADDGAYVLAWLWISAADAGIADADDDEQADASDTVPPTATA